MSENQRQQDEMDKMLEFIKTLGISIRAIQETAEYISGEYRRMYIELLSRWNEQSARERLRTRVKLPAKFAAQLGAPAAYDSSESG